MWLLWKQEVRPDGKQIISFKSYVRCTVESEDMIGNKDRSCGRGSYAILQALNQAVTGAV